MSSGREGQVVAAFVSLVDGLLDDFDVIEVLEDLTEQCAQLLDVATAGLLLADARGQLHLMAATSKRTHDLELLQLQADEGPCLDCFHAGVAVSASDLDDADRRWPQFAPAAREAGFASVHAVPMRAAGTVVGALGLFGEHPGTLNADDQAVAQALAHVATVAIVQDQGPTPATLTPRLQTALHDRIVVEQAKGFLHEHFDISVDDAFALLRRYARDRRAHLTDVARSLVSDPQRRPELVADLAAVHTAL